MISTPVAFAYGLHAFRTAPDRPWACIALALAVFALTLWCCMLLMIGPAAVMVGIVLGVAIALRQTLKDLLEDLLK